MIEEYPPSSPSVALFKNGVLIYFMQRLDIEGYNADHIANELISVFNEHCSAQGPSIPAEAFAEVQYAKQCGSKIPLYKG